MTLTWPFSSFPPPIFRSIILPCVMTVTVVNNVAVLFPSPQPVLQAERKNRVKSLPPFNVYVHKWGKSEGRRLLKMLRPSELWLFLNFLCMKPECPAPFELCRFIFLLLCWRYGCFRKLSRIIRRGTAECRFFFKKLDFKINGAIVELKLSTLMYVHMYILGQWIINFSDHHLGRHEKSIFVIFVKFHIFDPLIISVGRYLRSLNNGTMK